MDHPPSPSGLRTRTKTVCLTASTPSHRTAAPRATSGSRHPPSYAAAMMTPHRASYYDLLHAATDLNDDNPFHDDFADEVDQGSGEIEQGSPILLTNPAGVDATVTDTAKVADASTGPGVVTSNAPDTVVMVPPPQCQYLRDQGCPHGRLRAAIGEARFPHQQLLGGGQY
jgi:hypothetical protein